MTYTIVYALEARLDLADLFEYNAGKRGEDFAGDYIRKIMDHCNRFDLFPKRGTLRDDIEPGLRLVGYRRKATIAFRIDHDTVVITRVLYGGKSLGGSDDMEDDDDFF
ncbi:type II toxin-antitoxin system RelE/ParE family toxin [Rhizobium terrae]|uniref:type II toxin-antitoxin system RelE/ParE family toxin n=1 Tax=Rhizobium terrae TaxID=2171756 RepID=UPI000E3D5ED6|nr:type II toxin-antitoxin system RelE/ParE family toxin [Rhizobium terrae]